MEFFDVVDKNRNKLNYKKARGESLQDNEYNMGAEMWIINNNKLLMTQRSVQKTHSGGWEVPGGCCQAGETTEDTIKREMKEEIGIKFEQDEFVLVGAQLYKKQFIDIFKTQKKINNCIHSIWSCILCENANNKRRVRRYENRLTISTGKS